MVLKFLRWRKPRTKPERIRVRIVDAPEEWTKEDSVVLQQFLSRGTGEKLLANIEHSIYLEVLSEKELSQWADGRRAGMATIANSLRDYSVVPLADDEDFDDEEDAN